MSSPIRDCGEGWRSLGISLNEFLYKDGLPPTQKRAINLNDHTKEELTNYLEEIRLDAWNNYDDIAKEMGWKE